MRFSRKYEHWSNALLGGVLRWEAEQTMQDVEMFWQPLFAIVDALHLRKWHHHTVASRFDKKALQCSL
jgi:hypothetical protein